MTFTSDALVHLCGADEWSRACQEGAILPQSTDGVAGFIHLSTPQQVHLPANRLYRGRSDLLMLHIDAGLLDSPVRWEPGVSTDPTAMVFPHLYGPLPLRAVMRVTDYRPGRDGAFPPIAEVPGLGWSAQA